MTTALEPPASCFSLARAQALRELLNQDPVFAERGAHFAGSLALAMGQDHWTFFLHYGQVAGARQGLPPEGVDFTIAGPVEEWVEVCSGRKHLLAALNPYLGRLRLAGNIVLYAGSNRAVFHLVSQLRKVC